MSWKWLLTLLHILAVLLLGVALVVSVLGKDVVWSLCLAAAIASEVSQILTPLMSGKGEEKP